MMNNDWDVLVVGGGHAGIEAAAAAVSPSAARIRASTRLRIPFSKSSFIWAESARARSR